MMENLLREIKSIIDNTNNIDFKGLKKDLDEFLNNKIKERKITKCKRKKIIRPPLFISDSSSDSN